MADGTGPPAAKFSADRAAARTEGHPGGHRLPHVIDAPEVAVRILARRAACERLGTIAGDLHLTPGEVSGVIRAAGGRP